MILIQGPTVGKCQRRQQGQLEQSWPQLGPCEVGTTKINRREAGRKTGQLMDEAVIDGNGQPGAFQRSQPF